MSPIAPSFSVDQTCAAEPIHTPGMIQPHGMLIAVDPGRAMAIAAFSANIVSLCGIPELPGLSDVLGQDFANALQDNLRAKTVGAQTPWETTLTLPAPLGSADPQARSFHVTSHTHADLVFVELEPSEPHDDHHAFEAARHLSHGLGQLRGERRGLEHLTHAAAQGIRRITNYERVLVYRFDEDWNGQAVAEDCTPDLDPPWPASLLGLHFPASDIPAQARALYHLAHLRTVASRDGEPVPLVTSPHWTGAIDLSHARLRTLSPAHMQYHRNLGVDGTMSVSIMVDDRLWGLIVCHHRRPHRASAGQRAAVSALADALAHRVVSAERFATDALRRAEQGRIARLTVQMAQASDLASALSSGEITASDLFASAGAALVQGAQYTTMGITPPEPVLQKLTAWLREVAPAGDVFSSDCLTALIPDLAPDPAIASGLLAAFLTEDRADMLLWFRPEIVRGRKWGGDPRSHGPVPRADFSPWSEVRLGMARPWAPYEIDSAALLRHAITEVIVRNLRHIASLNDQLRQSQKMEAVGQLTGGLAHDFNNLLGGITGSLELARTRMAQGRTAELDRYLAAAAGAATRAAALTHRLLAFARRQTLDPRPVDANQLVASIEDLIRRTAGSNVQLNCVAAAGLWTILCDPNQLENAILNLALNARDAMPDGGQLTIEAANTHLDDTSAAPFGLPSGHYVAVSVSDTGSGMTPETANRAFEPFFTTKPQGQGTGLGLSMVYGFAKQSGGHTRIFSKPGRGTTVRLYLPRHEGLVTPDPLAPTEQVAAQLTTATILVVDDEPILRMLICEVLREQNVTVLEAQLAGEALPILQSAQKLDLLVTDVGLPGGMNGRQLADAARIIRPSLKILFITGYAEKAALSGGLLDPVTQVLTKPFAIEAFMGKIRAMLG